MPESMPVVRSVPLLMPVIEVKIVEHGSHQQCFHIGMQRQFSVQIVAQLCHLFTVLIGGNIAVLDIFFHFLYMLV